MKQPNVLWIEAFQQMKTSESSKECSPRSGKVSSNLDPQPFDPCVMSGSKTMLFLCMVIQIVLATHDPHMKDARFWPRYMTIKMDKSMFSPPRSPRTRDGQPYSLIACRNSFNTVIESLFVLGSIAVIFFYSNINIESNSEEGTDLLTVRSNPSVIP